MSDELRFDSFNSPVGELRVISNGSALTGLYMMDAEGRRESSVAANGKSKSTSLGERRDADLLRSVRDQIAAWFAGELREFDLELSPSGTPFQLRVWEELRRIPYGDTINYGELAARIGAPKAVRAVGAANGRNPISIIVPCHRVIGANGTLTGYGGGLDRKRILLDHEARFSGRSLFTLHDSDAARLIRVGD